MKLHFEAGQDFNMLKGKVQEIGDVNKACNWICEAIDKGDIKPEECSIRDMYEALEKMARIVCSNNKNLKANAEQFVGKLSLSIYYTKMLKDYTEFAHEFRHAVEEGKERVLPPPPEVEAFVYTTGLFIRLAVESLP